MTELLTGTEQAITAGLAHFRRTSEELFGVVVTIYLMRDMRLPGELKSDVQAIACYGPTRRLPRETR